MKLAMLRESLQVLGMVLGLGLGQGQERRLALALEQRGAERDGEAPLNNGHAATLWGLLVVAVVLVTLAANAPTARWRTEPLCKTRSLMSNETRDEEGHNRPSSIIVVEWLL